MTFIKKTNESGWDIREAPLPEGGIVRAVLYPGFTYNPQDPFGPPVPLAERPKRTGWDCISIVMIGQPPPRSNGCFYAVWKEFGFPRVPINTYWQATDDPANWPGLTGPLTEA